MTIYVSDRPYNGQYFLWADTSDEAICTCYALGMEAPERVAWFNAWECYLLDLEQFTDAIIMGVTVTDRYGPALYCLKRDGATERYEALQLARANWILRGSPE